MKKQDRKRFLMAIAKTRVSLPGINLTQEEEAMRTDVFWEELQFYSIGSVEDAFQSARGELSFFPKPVEIIERIHQPKNERVPERIEWMAPTEEGRRAALKVFDELHKKWDEENRIKEEKRKVEFEKNRSKLKKQAKAFQK